MYADGKLLNESPLVLCVRTRPYEKNTIAHKLTTFSNILPITFLATATLLFNWIGVVSHFWLRFPAVSCRQMLGIHYRFDGQEGLTLGETVAVRLLHQVNVICQPTPRTRCGGGSP